MTQDRIDLDCVDCARYQTSSPECRACTQEGDLTGVWLPMFTPKKPTMSTTPTRGRLAGLNGKARCGKDTAANFLVERFGFTKGSFAAPIRAFILLLLGLDHFSELEAIKDDPHPLLGGKTPRYAMQTLGTEWGRQLVSETLWLDVLERKVRALLDAGKNVVISDVRFDNEAALIHKMGGVVVNIVRPDQKEIGGSGHKSESGVKPELFDAIVLNTGTPEALGCRVAGHVL